jgi:hypothetical protein
LKIRKDLVFAVLLTLCLSSVISAMPIIGRPLQSPTYDPHADVNDDGKINMYDVGYVSQRVGTEGTPFVHKLFRYTIDTNGTTYFAYNGTSGGLEYQTQSASDIVTYCISQIRSDISDTSGGIIHFRNGYYSFSSQVVINKPNIILEGEGYATAIAVGSSLTCLINISSTTSARTSNVTIRDLRFCNTGAGNAAAIMLHNNDWRLVRILWPTIENCYFYKIDGITTDTSGYDYTHQDSQLLEGIRVSHCVFDQSPHFGIKLWNTIDGTIQDVNMIFGPPKAAPGSGVVGIELVYPCNRLSTGIYFDDVAIVYPSIGINYTNGSEGWFSNIVTDYCSDVGFLISNCQRAMISNAYSSSSSLTHGTGFKLINSYKNRFVSCTAFNCCEGFWSADETSDPSNYNTFVGSISETNNQSWYRIQKHDKFSACNYIIQNASYATILAGNSSVTVYHGLSLAAGTQPDVLTVTALAQTPVAVSVYNVTNLSFEIHRSGTSGDLTVYWYAAMGCHLP